MTIQPTTLHELCSGLDLPPSESAHPVLSVASVGLPIYAASTSESALFLSVAPRLPPRRTRKLPPADNPAKEEVGSTALPLGSQPENPPRNAAPHF